MVSKPKYLSGIEWRSTSQQNDRGPVADGSLRIADALFVKIVVWETNGELQVAFPRTANPKFDSNKPAGKDNKKYFDEAGPVSKEAREELFPYILADLERERSSGNNGASASTSKPTSTRASAGARANDPIPF